MNSIVYIATRDLTPEGDVCIWRDYPDVDIQLSEDGHWDVPYWDAPDMGSPLFMEVSHDEFSQTSGLELGRGKRRYVHLEWTNAEE